MTGLAVVAFAAALVFIAGIAIGVTSVGGVLVLPALTSVLGVEVARAVAATSFGFLATGLLALISVARERGDAVADVRSDAPLHVAAFVGAVLGALAVHAVPSGWVRLWIAALAIASGLHALLGRPRAGPARPWPRAGTLAPLGLIVGFGSGLSGTGGPILLLPLLLLGGRDAARSVAAALVLQIPIALASTATHVAAGGLDLRLGLLVAAGLAGGAWFGRRIARRVDAAGLKRATGVVLVAVGIAYAAA